MIYFPLLNPIVFQPLLELEPATAELFRGRAQAFPSGEKVLVQFYDAAQPPVLLTPRVYFDFDDGTSADAGAVMEEDPLGLTNSAGISCRYYVLSVVLPSFRTFRMRVEAGDVEAVSGCITTEADTSSLRRLLFGSGEQMEFDTLMEGPSVSFTPTVYIPGGFFTSGFTPVIDGEEFLDANRVSRYLGAWPSITRDFVMGGAQGLDNRLVAFLNAAFCLPEISIDGERYVRYGGASFKALGDKSVPCRAWSVTLQHAGGDYSTAYGADTVQGALVDASGRYLADAAGKWIQTT